MFDRDVSRRYYAHDIRPNNIFMCFLSEAILGAERFFIWNFKNGIFKGWATYKISHKMRQIMAVNK